MTITCFQPKSYEFGYAVKDDYSGNDYKRREQSDGNQVNGEYRVQLPDGRTQIVTYYADWKTGFHADVRYEGTANYPEQYNTYKGNSGNYNTGYNSPSNQYGAPAGGNQHFGGNQPSNSYGAPSGSSFGSATSSVNIKDFSGPGEPYHTGSGYSGGFGNAGVGHSVDITHGNQFDSYANNELSGSRRPNTHYGAP